MTLRSVVIALALLLPLGYLIAWFSVIGPLSKSSQAPNNYHVPGHLGPWSVIREEELDSYSLEVLEPSAYVSRLYASNEASLIHVYVAFYEGRVGQASPHDPRVCYPSQGWSTEEESAIQLVLPDSTAFPIKLLEVRRRNERQIAIYWFQPAKRWPSSELAEQLYYIVDSVLGTPQYAFVRLAANVPSEALRPQTIQHLLDLAKHLAGPVRGTLGTASDITERSSVSERPIDTVASG